MRASGQPPERSRIPFAVRFTSCSKFFVLPFYVLEELFRIVVDVDVIYDIAQATWSETAVLGVSLAFCKVPENGYGLFHHGRLAHLKLPVSSRMMLR